MKQMMNISSFIIHPDGSKQVFKNNGKNDSFVISLCELLQQLSDSYNKLFKNQVIEVHLTSHKNGYYKKSTDKKYMLYDYENKFSTEEKQNIENMLFNEFIVVNKYPQAKYISDLAYKKTPIKTIINKTRTKFRKNTQLPIP
jgi:hypothetical protein